MPDGIHTRQLDYPADSPGGFGSFAPVSAPEPTGETEVTIHEDGSVTLASPAVHSRDEPDAKKFSENLALGDGDLIGLGYELSEGIDADLNTRKGWIDNYTEGMDLLGIQIEDARNSKRGPASRIGHPLLLAAIVKAQSAASAELMPARGPCKIELRDDDAGADDDLAQALERDMNWYLTKGAPEYYPDMHRGLFGLMYSGNMFKKVYEHPLRRRPVADTIDVADLIVTEDATDLDTALRVTHRSEVSRAMVKRMQRAKIWRDADLMQPTASMTQDQRKKDDITGMTPISLRPQDLPYTFYETTADLVLDDYGIKDRLAPGDLPVSYAVTMDKDSKQVLGIHRQWKAADEEFQRRQRIVQYGLIPAFGFLCLGHLHLLGNQTKALRAIWRILVTAGMYANAPGGIKVKGTRTSTNEMNPEPGEWVEADIGGMGDIRQAFMPMPYKDPSAVFIQLAEMIGKDSAEIAMAAQTPLGEGRGDIPVGTILAMIEQSTKVESAIHKGLYRSQARELSMLKDLFAENPEALWRLNPNPAREWQTAAEFENRNLVPAADPNVPSQIHRIMLSTAMVTLASQNPDIYDRKKVHERAWRNIGVGDTDDFLHDPSPQPGPPGAAPPDPALGQAKLIEAQAKVAKAQTDATDTQRKAANETLETQVRAQEHQQEAQAHAADLASQERIQDARLDVERERLAIEESRAAREHELAVAQTALEHGRHGDEMMLKRKIAAKPVVKGKSK